MYSHVVNYVNKYAHFCNNCLLFYQVQEEFGLPDLGWKVYQNREKSAEIRQSRSKTVNTYKIR